MADEVTRPRKDNEPIPADLHVQLVSGAEPRTIRDLSANDVGKLIKVPGIAVSASQVRSKASVLSLRCRSCEHTKSNIQVRAGLEGYTLPRKCEAEQTAAREQCPLDPYILVPEMCQCRDFQNIKLQESPDSIPTAEMPRHIGLYMERSLVDQIVPGNRVTITGIFQIKRQQVWRSFLSARYCFFSFITVTLQCIYSVWDSMMLRLIFQVVWRLWCDTSF